MLYTRIHKKNKNRMSDEYRVKDKQTQTTAKRHTNQRWKYVN